MIIHMINSKKRLTTSQMAKPAKCLERSITNIRKKMRLFGSPNPPKIPPGPAPIVTSVMLDTLCDHLAKIPGLYLEEMAKFLWDHRRLTFNVLFLRLVDQEGSLAESQKAKPSTTIFLLRQDIRV
jgi:hypothetical protein